MRACFRSSIHRLSNINDLATWTEGGKKVHDYQFSGVPATRSKGSSHRLLIGLSLSCYNRVDSCLVKPLVLVPVNAGSIRNRKI